MLLLAVFTKILNIRKKVLSFTLMVNVDFLFRKAIIDIN